MISAFSALETAVVIEARKGASGGRELDLLLHKAKIEVVPMTADHFAVARDAYARYGKGKHAAGLNLGDCCSYALARYSGEPLLFVGNDFAKTDAKAVEYWNLTHARRQVRVPEPTAARSAGTGKRS